jgi:multisubunit Na+/H+ antiporter MnhC subunit
MQPGPEPETWPTAPTQAGWQGGLGEINARREVIWLSLAAAEMCWVVPAFWALTWAIVPHPPLLLWIGMLVLMLGFSTFYRALVSASLALRLQQGLLAMGLVLCIGLVLRFHVLAGSGLRAVDWFLIPFRNLGNASPKVPLSWVTIMLLIYLWARAIHLATRSISAERVGFSFRSGVLILVVVAFLVQVFTALDASGFVIAYFFFALVAVALARVEEVSRLPNSTRVPFSGFWIGSTVAAVAVLVVLGMSVALFLTGGGLDRVLRWLSPVLQVVQAVVVGVGVLLVMVLEWFLGLFSLDLTELGGQLREALARLGQLPEPPPQMPPPEGEPQAWLIITKALQILITVVIPVAIVSVILFLTWRRMRQGSGEERSEESRESLLSIGAVANSLQSMLQDSLQRLGELAGLVRRFGPGARFLAAVSIRRIYSNMVRMATEAGYPREETQTPYEYLAVLRQAFPESEAEVTIITEAYVNAHYGQVPDSHEEIQRIRDCWERARARESKKRSQRAVPDE